MALPILSDNQLLSFQVGFASYSHFRKAHAPENSKAKSWGRGILDLDFDAQKCIIRNGEHTLLMEPFREFQTIVTREDDSDHFLTITFEADEWDIVPQNTAETACIVHLAQYIGKDQIATATEVAKSGIQKGILGLEQIPIFKQGLLQQHDQCGRKLQARFLIVVPGKVFGFQRQQEMVGCPASFVTSLFNARVTTLPEVPGFQLHVERSEPLYFDTLQVERPSWIKELNASIEFSKNFLNRVSAMPRLSTRTSKVQWKETNQDPQQQLSSTTDSSNAQVKSTDASASQKNDFMIAYVGFDPTEGAPTNAQVHDEESGNKERGAESLARSKPLSRARICLEDSLSELKILVGHIQAASYVLNDLRLHTSSNFPQEKKYPSSTMSRWSSTGKERSAPHSNWQHHYASNTSHQDLMMWPESSLKSRFDHDLLYSSRNYLKVPHETSLTGRWKDAQKAPYLQTTYQKQPISAIRELGQLQPDNERFYSSTEILPLDTHNYGTGRKSTMKQTCSLNATGDLNDEQSSESDVEVSSPSYSETQENNEATSSQPLTATPTLQKGSTMMKPSLSQQASARASRAVAFMAHPDVLNISDDAISQMQAQPQTVILTKHASDDSASRQSGSIEKPYIASEPRASQTEFPLVEYQPSSGEDLLEDNSTSNTRQSQSSARKSTQQALAYTQPRYSRMQPADLTELVEDGNEGDPNFDSNTLALPNRQDFDGVNLAQDDDEDKSMPNSLGNSSNQGSGNLALKSRDQIETRKSTPNYNGSFVGESPEGGRRRTYQATNQDTVSFQPETRKGRASRQLLEATFQPETKKTLATGQSQKAMSLPEIKKGTALLTRHSEDTTFLPETRKSAALSRQSAGNVLQPEVRKSMALNKQNQDSVFQPDMRKSVGAYRQPFNRSSTMSVQPNASTGELRKSIYQGGNAQTESNLQEVDTDQFSGEMYDLHQESDPSDMSSSMSSSSESSARPSGTNESAKPSFIDSPNMKDQGETVAPAAPAKLENRKMTVASTSNGRALEQVPAASKQQRLPSRPSAPESSRAFMRSNTTPRGNNQESHIKFDDNLRGVNNRRHSQS